jgi:hypothetical protein
VIYAKLGAVVGIAGLLLSGALWFRGVLRERAELRTAYAAAIDANEEQVKALADLQAQAMRDGQAVAEMVREKDAATARERATARKLAEVLKGDPNARKWAEEPIPAGMLPVLNDEDGHQDGGGAPPASAGTSGALPATASEADGSHG